MAAGRRRFPVMLRWLRIGAALIVTNAQAQAVLREWRGLPRSVYDDAFGTVLLAVGDVDGDGVVDVAIGANETVLNMSRAGACHLFSGRDGSLLRSFLGVAPQEAFGFKVTPAGDFDGDGRPDLLIAAVDPNNVFDVVSHVVSTATGARLLQFRNRGGSAVGDIDRDGVPDLLLGEARYASYTGRADLYSGRDQRVMASFLGQFPNQTFGAAFAPGDLDGDTVPELGVAAYGNWPYAWGSGLWVFSGRTFTLMHRIAPPPTSDSFPYSEIIVADVDGDGVSDLLLGHIGRRDFPSGAQVVAYSGRSGAQIFAIPNFPNGAVVGSAVGAVGDLDGDGHDDVLHGADATYVQSGRDREILFRVVGEGGVHSILPPGDVNGDDFPDVLVGGYYEVATQRRRVRIYSGIPAGVQTFGASCPDHRGVQPRIGASGSPRRGTRYGIHLSRVESGLDAVLVLGTSNTAWWSGSLPFELRPFGFAGCFLRVSPDASVAVATSGPPALGRATVTLDIPAVPSIVGGRFFAQWLVVDKRGPALRLTATRGLDLQVLP